MCTHSHIHACSIHKLSIWPGPCLANHMAQHSSGVYQHPAMSWRCGLCWWVLTDQLAHQQGYSVHFGPCVLRHTGSATRFCGDGGIWDDPLVLECQSLEILRVEMEVPFAWRGSILCPGTMCTLHLNLHGYCRALGCYSPSVRRSDRECHSRTTGKSYNCDWAADGCHSDRGCLPTPIRLEQYKQHCGTGRPITLWGYHSSIILY